MIPDIDTIARIAYGSYVGSLATTIVIQLFLASRRPPPPGLTRIAVFVIGLVGGTAGGVALTLLFYAVTGGG